MSATYLTYTLMSTSVFAGALIAAAMTMVDTGEATVKTVLSLCWALALIGAFVAGMGFAS